MLFGFVLIAALNYRRIIGGTLIGILVVALIGIPLGLTQYNGIVSLPPSIEPTLLKLDFSRVLEGTFLIVIFSISVHRRVRQCRHADRRHPPHRLDEGRQARAHEGGADLRQLRRHVRRADRHLDHDELHRERGRRRRRRPHRPDRGRGRGAVPAGAVLLAARRHDPGLRDRRRAVLRRLRDGARPGRDRLGRHHRIRAGGGGRHHHAADLFDRHRHRPRLHHLCAGQAVRRPASRKPRRRWWCWRSCSPSSSP